MMPSVRRQYRRAIVFDAEQRKVLFIASLLSQRPDFDAQVAFVQTLLCADKTNLSMVNSKFGSNQVLGGVSIQAFRSQRLLRQR